MSVVAPAEHCSVLLNCGSAPVFRQQVIGLALAGMNMTSGPFTARKRNLQGGSGSPGEQPLLAYIYDHTLGIHDNPTERIHECVKEGFVRFQRDPVDGFAPIGI